MARKPNTQAPENHASGIDQSSLDSSAGALAQRSSELATIDGEYGIDVPYSLDLFILRIRQNAAESASRMIEIGRMLIMIRERETRETFAEVVQCIGIAPRFAQRTMQAAIKLQDRPGIASLGSSKALELLSEDDDTLDVLEQGGTLAGHTLDELDTMTVRELKQTLRDERQEAAASEELLRKKDERINKLVRERKRVNQSAARVQVDDLLSDMDVATVELIAQAKTMRDLISAIEEAYVEHGETIEEDVASRIESNQQQALAWIRQIDPDSAE